MIRKATIDDLPDLLPMALEALDSTEMGMRPDPERTLRVVVEVIMSGYAQVAVDKFGKLIGMVGALVAEDVFFPCKRATLVTFWARKPGAGVELLRDFRRWLEENAEVRFAIASVEAGADPRTKALLKRLGFEREHPEMVWMRQS